MTSSRAWPRWRIAENGCWEWLLGKDEDGYGRCKVKGRDFRAHRWVYAAMRGPIPAGKLLMHSCDNPGCVNPDHLEIGTHLENHGQRNARNRQAKGERSGSAKFSNDLVNSLRLRYRSDRSTSTHRLAKEFGISITHVKRLLRGESRSLERLPGYPRARRRDQVTNSEIFT